MHHLLVEMKNFPGSWRCGDDFCWNLLLTQAFAEETLTSDDGDAHE